MRKCFISFKKEDKQYKDFLIEKYGSECFVDKTLDRTINSLDGDYVMQVIRNDYLRDSTVTLFLIGAHSSEQEGYDVYGDKNYFIKRELAASLFNGPGNTRNGILGIVLPDMYNRVYKGTYSCSKCGQVHSYVEIGDSTTIREFSANYYTQPHFGCSWKDNERYCILVKWDEFLTDPEHYIEIAFDKRFSPVANKIRIRNLR